MVNATYTLFKILYLKEQGTPLEGTCIADQGSYNNYRLTGKFVTTKSLASGSGFLNIHSRKYDDDILKLAGTERNQLPSLQESSRVYPLSKEGACLLGIPEGTPVVLTNPDGGLNQIDAGAIREGIMTFSVGTSGAMRMSTGRPVIPETPSAWCYLSPKNWMSGAASAGCCNCVDWFVRQINLGQSGYFDLEKNEQEILDTPVFLPFLYGERCPGWDDSRRGGFELLEPHHDISDMYRGVQQGILFNLYQCYQILVDVAGVPEQIKLSGGILNSAVWTRMCADIFGRTAGGSICLFWLMCGATDASSGERSLRRSKPRDRDRAKSPYLWKKGFRMYGIMKKPSGRLSVSVRGRESRRWDTLLPFMSMIIIERPICRSGSYRH